MPSDICFLHFRVHDLTLSTTPAATATSSNNNENSNSNNNTTDSTASRQGSTVAKAGLHKWLCQLSILDDKTTVRGLLGPLVDPELKKAAALAACCTLQVATAPQDPATTTGSGAASTSTKTSPRVLYATTIQSEDLFRQGVEFYMDRQDVLVDRHYYEFTLILSSLHIKLLGPPDGPQETHTLALSECDPVARNVDPLVEMMTQFQQHTPTTDVECRFIDRNGHVRDYIRAHQAILSIYPTFSEKLAQAQSNPYQRSKDVVVVLHLPVEACAVFQRMLEFIYSGKLPIEAFNPRNNEQWKRTFDLIKEYGLDQSPNSSPWMEWHLQELKQVLTEENVLEIYFAWGFEHEDVAGLCVDHVSDRQHVQYQGQEFHSVVQDMIKTRFLGKPGYREFQDAFVNRDWTIYANQQQKHQLQQFQLQGDHSIFSSAHAARRRQLQLLHQQQRSQQRQERQRHMRGRFRS
ncbi:hypothetical protein BGZ95_000492 [Linnemannia exigua]|uniref:BTB domain-containing protein n=1 Tax=Linnemannia exigua TaxID=604196 RepID=A0AAD4H4D7_9FUNG|nr:hypothetical protein BGZ95_000492 [Linnemannia exigua]